MSGTVPGRYTGSEYLDANPHWHAEDAPWKAGQIRRALDGLEPLSVCEVGCGAGAILAELQRDMPNAKFVGYDIAPAAIELAKARANEGLRFELGDPATSPERFDVLLVIDVVEHVTDPTSFLSALRPKATTTVLHIPLDMTLLNVARPGKFDQLRSTVGHIHYFTPETAIATIEDAGYRVISSFFTQSFKTTQPTLNAKVAMYPRLVIPPRIAARTIGGYSLMVTAESRR